MNSVLMGLVALEIALTAVAVGILIWRGLLSVKEDDHLVLSKAEAHLEREQIEIREREIMLGGYIKKIGLAWGLLLVTILSLWMFVEVL